jgi:hypothetical protein
MYENILKRIGIEGDNESDKFRSLVEFLFDYFEVNPVVPVEARVEKLSDERSRLDVLDLVIKSLKDHEANLDRVAARLEKATVSSMSGVSG